MFYSDYNYPLKRHEQGRTAVPYRWLRHQLQSQQFLTDQVCAHQQFKRTLLVVEPSTQLVVQSRYCEIKFFLRERKETR